ncbi:MAG: hypothetical protein PVSMB1_19540 [Gemmatimonadaceae bacterium]
MVPFMNDIFDAISSGDFQAIRQIVQADGSVLNAAIGKYGQSPLMHAIHEVDRRFEIIEFLVEQGADVNFATEEGYTPLHSNMDLNGPSGSGEMPYRVARLLKHHGADTEIRNHYGWIPLLRAALEGTADEFKALLEIGAKYDVSYPDCSMPVFTRGKSLASIVMPQPEKISIRLEFGFKPDQSLILESKRALSEADDPNSCYSSGIRRSLDIISRALGC